MNICFIGGGNMAGALLGGLLQQGYSPAQIGVVEINAEQRDRIKREFSVEATAELSNGVAKSGEAGPGVIVLAIKPQQLSMVARELAPLLSDQLVISIAAGIRATDISHWMGGYRQVVRAMPNTPALVRAGVTGLYALPGVDKERRAHAETILGTVGSIVWCEQEELLHAVTAVSGSGPAYVFYFIEAMQQAALELGLSAAQARQLSLETFFGAAKLAIQDRENTAVLRVRVTSPGGTTERAIASLENDDVKGAIVRAIKKSYQRSRELGDELGST
ncbi:MAG TPA: pyrroline-5-carboxylate reductase [Nitrosospira sp.]|jgi:pyrroline-5-carboxylate reductase|nr:pyrroline-5-carboxylate reductase [Nitrosospira sp.]